MRRKAPLNDVKSNACCSAKSGILTRKVGRIVAMISPILQLMLAAWDASLCVRILNCAWLCLLQGKPNGSSGDWKPLFELERFRLISNSVKVHRRTFLGEALVTHRRAWFLFCRNLGNPSAGFHWLNQVKYRYRYTVAYCRGPNSSQSHYGRYRYFCTIISTRLSS